MLPLITIDQNISFIFNAQHDCEGGECGYAIDETNAQGGQPATKPDRRMMHSAHDKYFINLHALHNAWHLHEVLPRNLTKPVPYISDREEFHRKMARKLQKANPTKRARAKEKAKDAREQKKRVAELAEATDCEDERSDNKVHTAA